MGTIIMVLPPATTSSSPHLFSHGAARGMVPIKVGNGGRLRESVTAALQFTTL